jgi:hypothetical protein
MSTSLPTKQSDTKQTAPYKLIQSKNYNECNFLIHMLIDQCTLGTGLYTQAPTKVIKAPTQVIKAPTQVKQTCEDISIILERCILDGNNCNTNLYKFNVLCKGDIDTKL